METRRVKILRVTGQVILDMVKGGPHFYEVIKSEIPDDAKVTGMWVNFGNIRDIEIRIQSESFDKVIDFGIIPYMDPPVIKKLDLGPGKVEPLCQPVYFGPACHVCGSGSLWHFPTCPYYKEGYKKEPVVKVMAPLEDGDVITDAFGNRFVIRRG